VDKNHNHQPEEATMKKTANRKSLILILAIVVGLCCMTAGCLSPQVKGIAAVSADANLLRGVKVVSASKQPPGYRIEFDPSVDVANGYYLVTPGLSGSCNTMINAEKTSGNAVYVSFAGRGPDINFVDCAFTLVVY
jgi:hypothetical protein